MEEILKSEDLHTMIQTSVTKVCNTMFKAFKEDLHHMESNEYNKKRPPTELDENMAYQACLNLNLAHSEDIRTITDIRRRHRMVLLMKITD